MSSPQPALVARPTYLLTSNPFSPGDDFPSSGESVELPLGIMPVLCDYPHAAEVGFGNLIVASWNQAEKRFNKSDARRRFTLRFEHLTVEESDVLWYHYLAQRGTLHSFVYYDYLSGEAFTVRYNTDVAKRETYLHEVERQGVELIEIVQPEVVAVPAVVQPWEAWRSGQNYFTDVLGTLSAGPLDEAKSWRGVIRGILVIQDGALYGDDGPIVSATGDYLDFRTDQGPLDPTNESRNLYYSGDEFLDGFPGPDGTFSIMFKMRTRVDTAQTSLHDSFLYLFDAISGSTMEGECEILVRDIGGVGEDDFRWESYIDAFNASFDLYLHGVYTETPIAYDTEYIVTVSWTGETFEWWVGDDLVAVVVADQIEDYVPNPFRFSEFAFGHGATCRIYDVLFFDHGPLADTTRQTWKADL